MRVCLPFLALRRSPAALLALACCALASARAAPHSDSPADLTAVPLEQLMSMDVFSASRFSQRASEAPSSVTVITAADIRTYGWRTLADVMRSVRGLHVNYDRTGSYLGGRGFLRPGDYNTRFLLQVNGNRINDAAYDQAPLGGQFPLDLELIERIEFVPGPGSSAYGSNAFFGVINVITKTAGDPTANRVAAQAGSFGARKGSASASWRTAGGTGFLLSASRHMSDGDDLYYPEFDTPEQNNGISAGLDYERGARLFASVAHGPFSFTAIDARRVKGIPTASFMQSFNDPRSRAMDRQTYLALAYRAAAGATEEVSARVVHGRYDSSGDYVVPDLKRTLGHTGSQARWYGAELTLVSTRFSGHKIVAGVDAQGDYSLKQYLFSDAPAYPSYHHKTDGRRTGVYLQDEIALGQDLLLNLGARHDHSPGSHHSTSPRAALIYRMSPSTTFKAIHGGAFRAPNSFEMNFVFPGEGGQEANPGLGPERITTSELALVHDLGNNSHIVATAFSNKVDGLVTLLFNQRNWKMRFENTERASARGIEVEYERKWPSGASLRASYSRSRSFQPKTEEGIMMLSSTGIDPDSNPVGANSPAHLAKVNAALPLGWGWRAGAEAQYTGPRATLAGSTGSFWVANLNLASKRLFGHADLSVGVYNLFDRDYADPGSAEHLQAAIAQDGRTLRVTLAYAF
ncbi:MAG: TonB-dependent receptor plug domain-containing protein [Telluria sp.]